MKTLNSNLRLGTETVVVKESQMLCFDAINSHLSLHGLSGAPYCHTVQKQGQETLEYQLLQAANVAEMLELQDYIYEMLPTKSLLVKDGRADMLKAIENGLVLGLVNEAKKIVGYRLVDLPEPSDDHRLERDIAFKAPLKKAAHLETTLILPRYRGNQLQYKTLLKVEPLLQEAQVSDLLCTVSPFNVHSLNNILKAGLRIKALKRKYADKPDTGNSRGLWRFILHKALMPQHTESYPLHACIQRDKLDEQQSLLNKGFIGISLTPKKDQILYVHA